jgi:hypothetical protein
MRCAEYQRLLPLLIYDELSLDEENELHEHMEMCESCRDAYAREHAFQRVLEESEVEVPANLLVRCRSDLRNRTGHDLPRPRPQSVWRRLWDMEVPALVWKPATALALVAAGFFGARLMPAGDAPMAFFQGMGAASTPVAQKVRTVNRDAAGGVQLVVEETRQRTVRGNLTDEPIRALMVDTLRDPDPGLRVEMIEMLKGQTESTDVRQALLFALQNDANVGVRLSALEGLKRFSGDPDTRKALAHVLLTDDNAGMRTTAIDLMAPQRERDFVGVMQELLHKEDNPYVRQRCQRALREMNASLETF